MMSRSYELQEFEADYVGHVQWIEGMIRRVDGVLGFATVDEVVEAHADNRNRIDGRGRKLRLFEELGGELGREGYGGVDGMVGRVRELRGVLEVRWGVVGGLVGRLADPVGLLRRVVELEMVVGGGDGVIGGLVGGGVGGGDGVVGGLVGGGVGGGDGVMERLGAAGRADVNGAERPPGQRQDAPPPASGILEDNSRRDDPAPNEEPAMENGVFGTVEPDDEFFDFPLVDTDCLQAVKCEEGEGGKLGILVDEEEVGCGGESSGEGSADRDGLGVEKFEGSKIAGEMGPGASDCGEEVRGLRSEDCRVDSGNSDADSGTSSSDRSERELVCGGASSSSCGGESSGIRPCSGALEECPELKEPEANEEDGVAGTVETYDRFLGLPLVGDSGCLEEVGCGDGEGGRDPLGASSCGGGPSENDVRSVESPGGLNLERDGGHSGELQDENSGAPLSEGEVESPPNDNETPATPIIEESRNETSRCSKRQAASEEEPPKRPKLTIRQVTEPGPSKELNQQVTANTPHVDKHRVIQQINIPGTPPPKNTNPTDATEQTPPPITAETIDITITPHKKPRYTCTICNKNFTSESGVTYHKYCGISGTQPIPFRCEECGMTFSSKNEYNVHVTEHAAQKPYPCDVCGKRFNLKKKVTKHKTRCHTGDKAYKCGECGAGFAYSGHLLAHEKRHRGGGVHECEVCGKGFGTLRGLRKHVRGHRGKPSKSGNTTKNPKQTPQPTHYACIKCQRTFTLEKDLRRHFTSVHLKVYPFHCSICTDKFSRKDNLDRHCRLKHGGVKNPE